MIGSLCGVSGLLGRVRDAGGVEGTMLGSACKRPLGIGVRGFLEVGPTLRICRTHRGTARERGGVLNRGNAKLIILLDDLIDPWLACGGRGLVTLRVAIGRQRRRRGRVVRGMGGVGIEAGLGVPTGEITVFSHVLDTRFGHSRVSFSSVGPLYESQHVAGECVLG